MSEIELPAPAAVWRGDHTFHLNPEGMRLEQWRDHALYTAEQVRAAILAERERCARVCDEIASTKRMHARTEADDDEHAVAQMLQWKVDGAVDCAAAIRRGSV